MAGTSRLGPEDQGRPSGPADPRDGWSPWKDEDAGLIATGPPQSAMSTVLVTGGSGFIGPDRAIARPMP